jgi:uncharacterized protein with PIN domain
MDIHDQPRFACDAMLGRLARWLRAAGYDAFWQAHVADWDLIRSASREGRILLSSDTGIFRIGIIRDGDVPALFIPHGLSAQEQLAFVLSRFGLEIREPRCMGCGGELVEVDKEQVRSVVPARSFEWQERFWRCIRCEKVYWNGTHWRRIETELREYERPPAE